MDASLLETPPGRYTCFELKRVNALRVVALLLCCLILITPVLAETRVSVAQLEEFLTSKQAMKESDAEIADRLSEVVLSEELTGPTLARILSKINQGPRTAEQIELLAESSVFNVPPAAELPRELAPDSAMQQKMIEAARAYVNGAIRSLPDFLAVRVTRSFENTTADARPKNGKPKAQMHFVREYRREIAYRDGHEVEEQAGAKRRSAMPGLSTRGEFGGILKVVLDDAFSGRLAWDRWQRDDAGTQVAVFRYVIPQASSHYSVDFCCYVESKQNPVSLEFHVKPGYHGEIFVDPASGAIDRVTVEADLKPGDPVITSGIAVQYGWVSIGGKQFICPIRGVGVTDVRNLVMEPADRGLERRTNLIRFVNYHKFGSTVRILPGVPENEPE